MARWRREPVARARTLRREMTDAERRLWSKLRRGALDGYRFRRQHPVGPYIADFACVEAGLIVEIDGGQHAEQVERDERRTVYLEQAGFRVVRFWNTEVLRNTEGVVAEILLALDGRSLDRERP